MSVLVLGGTASAQDKTEPWNDNYKPGHSAEDREKSTKKGLIVGPAIVPNAGSMTAPANDNFANAQIISGSLSLLVTNVEATGEAGEPIHGAGRGADMPSQQNSLWYKYTAASTRVVVFYTQAGGTGDIGDTVLSAYTGSALNNLTPVAENDDYPNSYHARITFGAVAGQTYHIAVDGYRTATGNFYITYATPTAPMNDESISPEDLGSKPKSPVIGITGTTIGSTGSIGEFVHHSASSTPTNSIWYKWTAPTRGTYTFTTAGSNFDTIIAVYRTIGSQAVSPAGSNDDFGNTGVFTSRVSFSAYTGELFYIAIDGYSDDLGNTLLNWYPYKEESGKRYDLDGDSTTDIGIFRPSNGQWWINRSSGGHFALTFGTGTDRPTPADFTGDGKVDIAFWRPSDGYWYILRSEDFSFYSFPYGAPGDIPVAGHFDNDAKADPAVFRQSTSTWYAKKSRTNQNLIQTFGSPGDVPVPADYDSDGLADLAIFRPSNGQWWVNRSRDGLIATTFGTTGDIPLPGAYTSDGWANVAFWRPSTGEWYVLNHLGSSNYYSFPFGLSSDIPAPGDYDGDGKFDATVFRPSTATWYINRSFVPGTTIVTFGTTGDRPIASSYIP